MSFSLAIFGIDSGAGRVEILSRPGNLLEELVDFGDGYRADGVIHAMGSKGN